MKLKGFLLLDENLEMVRSISLDELMKYFGVNTRKKVEDKITFGHTFEGYTIVEDYDDEESDKQKNKFHWHKFYEGSRFNYYVGSDGSFIRKNKTTNKAEQVAVYKKRKHYMVKISQKEMDACRIYVEHFVFKRKLDSFNDIVICESDTYDINKIHIYTRSEYYKAKSTNKKIGYYENGKLKRVYASSREAAEDLYTNRQSVLDTCNGKSKNMWGLDLRYVSRRKAR